jgi:hypothetical protein
VEKPTARMVVKVPPLQETLEEEGAAALQIKAAPAVAAEVALAAEVAAIPPPLARAALAAEVAAIPPPLTRAALAVVGATRAEEAIPIRAPLVVRVIRLVPRILVVP